MASQTFQYAPFPMPGSTHIPQDYCFGLQLRVGRNLLRQILRPGFERHFLTGGRDVPVPSRSVAAHVRAVSGTDCEISDLREHQQTVGAVNISIRTESPCRRNGSC